MWFLHFLCLLYTDNTNLSEVLIKVTQPNAAKLAREIYGDTTEYASDLVNRYAWDTAIIFVQTYSEMSNYASQNKSTLFSN